MKRSFVAFAAAALPVLGYTHGTIGLQGTVDVAIESVNKDANPDLKKHDLLFTDGVWGGSRINFTGSEDLGNGLKAIFSLEYDASADDGTLLDPKIFWYGESWVGLKGGFGTLSLGALSLPMSYAISTGDQTGQVCYNTSSGLAEILNFATNQIYYSSPEIGGVTLLASYAAGEATSKTVTHDAPAGDHPNLSKLDDLYSIGAFGEWGDFSASVAYQHTDGAGINTLTHRTELAGSASMQFGKLGTGLGYGQAVDKLANNGREKTKGYYGSLSLKISDHDDAYLVAVRRISPASKHNNEEGVGLSYSHHITKLTSIYAALGISKAQSEDGGPDTKPRRMAIGLRHSF